MSDEDQKVVIVTGGSKGIGAGLVATYRQQGWAVVATSRTIKPAADPAVLTVAGDISDPSTAGRIVTAALEAFGLAVGVNLAGFFWLTQRLITEMLTRQSGHVVNISATLADYASSSTPSVLTSLTKGGLASATRSLAIEYAARGIRVSTVSPGVIQTPEPAPDTYDALAALHPLGRVGHAVTSSTASSTWSHPRSSPERSCTSTGARSPAADVRRRVRLGSASGRA